MTIKKDLKCSTCGYLKSEQYYEGEDPEQWCDYRGDLPMWVDEADFRSSEDPYQETLRSVDYLNKLSGYNCACYYEKR